MICIYVSIRIDRLSAGSSQKVDAKCSYSAKGKLQVARERKARPLWSYSDSARIVVDASLRRLSGISVACKKGLRCAINFYSSQCQRSSWRVAVVIRHCRRAMVRVRSRKEVTSDTTSGKPAKILCNGDASSGVRYSNRSTRQSSQRAMATSGPTTTPEHR